MAADPIEVAPVPLWRRLAPLVLAVALISVVLASLDLDGFVAHLRAIDYLGFSAFVIAIAVATLVLDAVATGHVYRRVLGAVRYRDLMIIRAASYLPTLVNHHVGQAWLTYFVARTYRAPLWRTAGATLLVYATTFGALVVVAAGSLLVGPARFGWLPTVVGGLAVLGAGYLVLLAVRPAALARRPLLAPLFEVGVLGHLGALAVRLPHVATLFVGAWVPFRFFAVDIPLVDALALVPPLLVLVALPITPQGVGARDAFAVQVFAGYATGSPAAQRAAVVASTLTFAVAFTLIQIALSLACYRRARRLLDRAAVSDARPAMT